MNTLSIVGNLAKDPELKYNSAGLPVCTFPVATTHKKNRDSEGQTTYHNVVVFGDMAENCAQTLAKGTRVVVMGRFEKRKYEKKDGSDGYADSLIADEVGVNLRFQTAEVSKRKKAGDAGSQTPITDEEEPF